MPGWRAGFARVMRTPRLRRCVPWQEQCAMPDRLPTTPSDHPGQDRLVTFAVRRNCPPSAIRRTSKALGEPGREPREGTIGSSRIAPRGPCTPRRDRGGSHETANALLVQGRQLAGPGPCRVLPHRDRRHRRAHLPGWPGQHDPEQRRDLGLTGTADPYPSAPGVRVSRSAGSDRGPVSHRRPHDLAIMWPAQQVIGPGTWAAGGDHRYLVTVVRLFQCR